MCQTKDALGGTKPERNGADSSDLRYDLIWSRFARSLNAAIENLHIQHTSLE